MKRKIKQQLKEDEFVSGFTRILGQVAAWKKEIIIAGVVLAGLVALWLGFLFLRGLQASKQSAVLGRIQTLRADLDKNPASVSQLEALTVKGKYARVAAAELASYWVEKGDLGRAEKALMAVKNTSRDFYYYQSQDMAGQIAALKGDYEGALKIYQAIEDAKPKDYMLDAALFHKAEVLEKKGDAAGALKLYKKIQTDYSLSYYGYDAGLRVRKLEPAK